MRGLESGSIDLVAIDPPYNVKKAGWNKKGKPAQYREWLRPYLAECQRVLKPSGSIAVFGVQPTILQPQLVLEDLGFIFQNYIACKARQGGNNGHILMRRHEDILLYSKSRPFFNRESVYEAREACGVRNMAGGFTTRSAYLTIGHIIPLIAQALSAPATRPRSL